MLKNHRLAAAISDCSFYEFKRQLEYKTVWYGSKLCLADRWFPSSQLCSGCGAKQPMPLNQRSYDCSSCNLSTDRDLNASINLLNYTRIAQPCKPSDGSLLPCSKLGTEHQLCNSSRTKWSYSRRTGGGAGCGGRLPGSPREAAKSHE